MRRKGGEFRKLHSISTQPTNRNFNQMLAKLLANLSLKDVPQENNIKIAK